MIFSWFELILLVGVSQGLITSFLLLRSKHNVTSNRCLALALIGFCILSGKMIINTMGLTQQPEYRYLPLAVEFAQAPLFYLYSVSLITPKFKFTPMKLLHFVPFAVFFAYGVLVYLQTIDLASIGAKDSVAQNYFYPSIKTVEDNLTIFSIAAYLFLAYSTLRNYRQKVKNNISDTDVSTLSWLLHIYLLCAGLGLFLAVNQVLDLVLDLQLNTNTHWKLYFIYIACIVYYFGFKGYKLPTITTQSASDFTIEKRHAVAKLTEDRIKQITDAFEEKVLKSKLYLTPSVSARDVAKVLGVSQSHLSNAINQYYSKSFRDVINHARVEEAKSRLVDPDYQKVSVLAIALECGFNSEASFYRIFKNKTGVSPRDYNSHNKKQYITNTISEK